ncbi:MAG TPA: glycosyltransferase family 2 protein [Lacipirellulaceae bacterium]|jgi:dolichol-phosphate mannosyltransferase
MLSVVIPVLDEAESLPQLHRELTRVASEEGYDLQLVIVDDGSTDASWSVIERLAADDPRVLGIRFRRNFGKAAALAAGFDAASGERIVTLDADLQDDPAEIPQLLAKIDEGFDLANGWKRVRRDPWQRVAASRAFNWLVSGLTGVKLHDHNCGLKCLRREVIHEVRLYGGLHRFLCVLAATRGFRVGEVAVRHRPRQYGSSKYSMSRFVKALVDLLTVKFVLAPRFRPQHVLGGIGLAAVGLGGLGITYLAAMWCLSRTVAGMAFVELHGSATFYCSLALLVIGTQCLVVGFLGEMIAAQLVRESDTYSIAEHTPPHGSPKVIPLGKSSDSP